MEERPEIARMLDDPETIRQSMRMMSNPSLMREMTRNADRALGNLDAMPGGHQALLRAHEEYIDPLYNAMSSTNGGAGADVNTYAADSAPNTDALPNPWGPAPAATPAAPAVATPAATPASTATPQAFPNMFAGMPQQQPGAAPAMMQNPMMQNPMMQNPMMQNPMMQNPAMQNQQGANPMQNMMQQMMQNPAMMQQAMQMAQAMRNPAGGAPGGLPNAQTPTTPSVQTPMQPMGMGPAAGVNPFQQMMMQQMMNQGAGQQAGTAPVGQAPNPVANMPEAMQRARFAAQLQQLAGMGFTDESKCLRALVQHEGRLDAALDVLLSGVGE